MKAKTFCLSTLTVCLSPFVFNLAFADQTAMPFDAFNRKTRRAPIDADIRILVVIIALSLLIIGGYVFVQGAKEYFTQSGKTKDSHGEERKEKRNGIRLMMIGIFLIAVGIATLLEVIYGHGGFREVPLESSRRLRLR